MAFVILSGKNGAGEGATGTDHCFSPPELVQATDESVAKTRIAAEMYTWKQRPSGFLGSKNSDLHSGDDDTHTNLCQRARPAHPYSCQRQKIRDAWLAGQITM